MIFYHVTPNSCASDILRDGLDPEKSKSSLKAVFLSGYKDTAQNYENMKDELCVLLKIELPEEFKEFLRPDNYELRDLIEGLSTKDLKSHGLFEGATHSDCTWEQSLAICDQVACTQRIPAEFIALVYPALRLQ